MIFLEPRKEKTEPQHDSGGGVMGVSGINGALSPNTEQQPCPSSMLQAHSSGGSGPTSNIASSVTSHSGYPLPRLVNMRDQHDSHLMNSSKIERPNTLGAGKLQRRLNICYDQCNYFSLLFIYYHTI